MAKRTRAEEVLRAEIESLPERYPGYRDDIVELVTIATRAVVQGDSHAHRTPALKKVIEAKATREQDDVEGPSV